MSFYTLTEDMHSSPSEEKEKFFLNPFMSINRLYDVINLLTVLARYNKAENKTYRIRDDSEILQSFIRKSFSKNIVYHV